MVRARLLTVVLSVVVTFITVLSATQDIWNKQGSRTLGRMSEVANNLAPLRRIRNAIRRHVCVGCKPD